MTTENLSLGQTFADEFAHEAAATRKLFERLPEDRFAWKPHQKSMSLGQLAAHIAEMAEWVKLAVTTSQLDYAVRPYQPFEPKTTAELLAYFDQTVAGAIEALEKAADDVMQGSWIVRSGERVYIEKARTRVLRSDCINHIIHHRGQLSVYLRLNEIALPGIYGPSADEENG